MSIPFVSVRLFGDKPSVCVRYDISGLPHERYYPLTRQGCRDAGEQIFALAASEWSYSSTCSYPHEVKPKCRLKVCDLVVEGYNRKSNEVASKIRSYQTKAVL